MLRFGYDNSVSGVSLLSGITTLPPAGGYLKVFYDDLVVKKYSSQLTVIYNTMKDEFVSLSFDYMPKGLKTDSISFNINFVDPEHLFFTIVQQNTSSGKGTFQQVTLHDIGAWVSQLSSSAKNLTAIERPTCSSEQNCDLATQILESFHATISPYIHKSMESWTPADLQNIVTQLETTDQLIRNANISRSYGR